MAKGAAPTQTASGRSILVIDDESSIRFGLTEWARTMDFTPYEAASGREGIEQFREQSVDCIVLDLRLGDMDGARGPEGDP